MSLSCLIVEKIALTVVVDFLRSKIIKYECATLSAVCAPINSVFCVVVVIFTLAYQPQYQYFDRRDQL